MTVGLEIAGSFAVITLNRPDKLNALSFEVLRELDGRLDEVARLSVRALIVTGAGNKAFCAGADIEELRHRQLMEQKRGAELGQTIFEKIARLPVVSIAAINGYAFGGGLELALACTLRIVSANAKMGLPEIRLGLIPGYGGTQRLPRLIGEARALDIILTGRTIDAAEACDFSWNRDPV
ncbi:enoyl-CoA hydratase/isomerase family protein [Nitratireductor thuwali]|uniref:Short-chain-enoyl-CoA hydratase n=1 Tax=Nitratireductor thuwali TaxID=2267699 RepID=A0ABY5MJN9_9HYPH|nr:Short-chain-enoyl-CoA hydratase [Nitratireductor thuwali]